MKLAEKIKTLRKQKELTQEQLANELQVSRSTISSWETSRSYPDLEMILVTSDFFEVSLDFLLREDGEVVKKLSFASKQKQIYLYAIGILLLFVANSIIGTMQFTAIPNQVSVEEIILVRDKAYNGEDPERDWNTTFQGTETSNNIFFSPNRDHFLLNGEGGQLTGSITGTYNFFNLFRSRSVEIRQSVLVKNNISNGVIAFKMAGPNEQVDFNLSEINIGMK